MPELATFQKQFLDRIDSRDVVGTPLAIYRNTSLFGAMRAIVDSFPTVAMIVGLAAIEALAGRFAEDCPPQSPILANYGAEFADWLGNHAIAADLPYLPSVAAIDRLRVEAHLSADAPEFGLEDLARLTAEEWSRCRVTLHPATRIGWYAMPAPTIWVAHRDPEMSEIEPEWQAEGILMARRAGAVGGYVIGPCEHRILHGLRLGETVGQAELASSRLYPATNISRTVRKFVASGAISSLKMKG
ncbi:hypothetical protein GRI89_17225 [Altererythrobacter salegens]|uniref:Putative DNA-binding domain-containing protein n=1 Tax=Croceibacterium salegens TaxID=1737568 RepID=A0A6I4T119_9SPHN|nr:DNA-binding domain-containing protein [Croceibacterium salegens]MXO61289.1 hypothetical protein [Croceibacterium salegens]